MILYGVGQIFEDGTIKDFDEIKYFNYFKDAEEHCAKLMSIMGWSYARSPYLAIFTQVDGIITQVEYLKYTKIDNLKIEVNKKLGEI